MLACRRFPKLKRKGLIVRTSSNSTRRVRARKHTLQNRMYTDLSIIDTFFSLSIIFLDYVEFAPYQQVHDLCHDDIARPWLATWQTSAGALRGVLGIVLVSYQGPRAASPRTQMKLVMKPKHHLAPLVQLQYGSAYSCETPRKIEIRNLWKIGDTRAYSIFKHIVSCRKLLLKLYYIFITYA